MKKLFALTLAACMILSLAACGGTPTPASTPASSEPASSSSTAQEPEQPTGEVYNLKITSEYSATESAGQITTLMAEKIEEYTGGRIQVDVYYNGELAKAADAAEAIAQGSNMMTFVGMDFFTSVPDLGILEGPYFFYEPEDINKIQGSDWWNEQITKLEEDNTLCLGTVYYGARHLIHNLGPDADSPADFQGVTMRSASTPMRYAMCEAMTGNVSTVAWSEIYSALSTGVADMCEAPLGSIIGTKIYEVCKYITLTSHICSDTGVFVAKSWYDTLPADVQEGLMKAINEVHELSFDYVTEAEQADREFLEGEGVTFIEVSSLDEWADATRSAYDAAGFTPGTYETCMELLGH